MNFDLREISSQFALAGEFVSAEKFGTGHINDTNKVVTDQDQYVLQRINTAIFKEPERLMDNYARVCRHIAGKVAAEKAHHPQSRRRFLQLISTSDGAPFSRDAAGNCWRCYRFVDQARTYDVLETPEQAFAAAAAFGNFQLDLQDMPGRLYETIPDFHHTPKRLAALKEAVRLDPLDRAKDVKRELDFIFQREKEFSIFVDLQSAGEIVERTTHNDTKLNNVLIDDKTGEGICVIDLDTVMPGVPHYDFGDMMRTGTSPAAEDETDLSKVTMRFPMFEALLKGYLSTAGKFLNPLEKGLLPVSGKIITLEIGIRFLTDYLSGDTYFKIARKKHNLDRCRTQIALAASMEKQMDAMCALLKE